MKRISVILILIAFVFPFFIYPLAGVENQRAGFREDVSRQRDVGRQNRERVIREVREHMNYINSRLEEGGNSRIDTPIDYELIENAEENDHIHTDGVIPPPQYGFVNASTLIMRSEPGTGSERIGTVSFGERLQLLLRYDEPDIINGKTDYWVLTRKNNGDEGWVFGAYLQKDRPARPDEQRRVIPSSDAFIIPVDGRRTSGFGYRVHPVSRKSHSFHSGIDIAAPTGTPVKAAEGGRVVTSNFNRGGYGNLIIIQHESDLATYYGHLHRRYKEQGDMVKKGEVIGEVGATGTATGPHLHFEVRRGGTALNPDKFLR